MSAPSAPLNQADAYHSYLVRLWREHPHAAWRASAQDVQTGEIVHFADLNLLFAFLQAQTIAEMLDDPQSFGQARE